MKFNALQNLAAASLIASSAFAQEDDDIFEQIIGTTSTETLVAEPSNTVVVDHPPVPILETPLQAVLFEQFQADTSRWKASHAKKNDEFSYVGEWAIEEPTVYPGFAGDKGLVVKSPAAHHAISAKFDEPLDNTEKSLVVQYEVKLQQGLECGGAYVKLLSENAALHAEEFSSETPYQIMFGPDKCGSTNKVHFIVRRKNPTTGEYEEKHLATPPPAKLNKLTNLYTLVIHPGNDFEIRINGDVVKAGNLLNENAFRPSFNPPKEIIDKDDLKPENWVDEPRIPDPEQATKPEDWDEDAPLYIADPEAVKPEDWNEEAPLYIPDPEAEIPEDWDEEEDGEWIAPLIDNPVCEELSGCGEWVAPQIRNPDYKGPWVQPLIANPEYKGEWAPRNIPNPDYFEDISASNLEPIGGLGFELWTMQADILFDNIYVGHSLHEAETIGNKTFFLKHALEEAEELEAVPPPTGQDPTGYPSELDYFKEAPIEYIKEVSREFLLSFSEDPYTAIVSQPFVTLGLAVAFSVFFSVVFGILGVLSSVFLNKAANDVSANKKREAEAAANEKSEDVAVASGKESSTSATKRKN